MKLYVHAGIGKTGTSAIQSALFHNSELLKQNGICYVGQFFETGFDLAQKTPTIANVFNQAVRQGEQHMRELVESRLSEVRTYCKAHGLDRIVWSNEGIFNSPRVMGPALQNVSEDFDCRLIVYLRRQDRWFVSAYKQWGLIHKTNAGPAQEFEDWYDRFKLHGNYADQLQRWEQFLPKENFDVRLYEKCGNVVEDLLGGVVGFPTERLDTTNLQSNQTPEDAILALFKIYNSQVDNALYPQELVRLLDGSGLLAKNIVSVNPDIRMPDREMLAAIRGEFEEQNRRLERYSSPGHDVIFPEDMDEKVVEGSTVEWQQVCAALLHSVVHLDQRLRRMARRLSALESKSDETAHATGDVASAEKE